MDAIIMEAFWYQKWKTLSRNSNDSLYKYFLRQYFDIYLGGTMPFTLVLNGDIISNNVSGLNPGSYSLFVMDANGCSRRNHFY